MATVDAQTTPRPALRPRHVRPCAHAARAPRQLCPRAPPSFLSAALARSRALSPSFPVPSPSAMVGNRARSSSSPPSLTTTATTSTPAFTPLRVAAEAALAARLTSRHRCSRPSQQPRPRALCLCGRPGGAPAVAPFSGHPRDLHTSPLRHHCPRRR